MLITEAKKSCDAGRSAGDAPAKWRLFAAIAVSASVREALHGEQRELKSRVPPGAVRWVPPEQFHLTLRFLGDVPSDLVASLVDSLAETCAHVPPFGLRVRGIGFFPGARSPRVIWAGVESGDETLVEFQRQVEEALSRHIVERPEDLVREKFLAHVTLGRFQKYRRHSTEGLRSLPESYNTRVFGEWRVHEAGLFRSELSPEGARHSLVASCRLMTK